MNGKLVYKSEKAALKMRVCGNITQKQHLCNNDVIICKMYVKLLGVESLYDFQ